VKKVTISSKDISQKQWSNLLLELNIMSKAWKPYAKLEINAPSISKIILLGTKKYNTKYNLRED
jgi:hypothetical protein